MSRFMKSFKAQPRPARYRVLYRGMTSPHRNGTQKSRDQPIHPPCTYRQAENIANGRLYKIADRGMWFHVGSNFTCVMMLPPYVESGLAASHLPPGHRVPRPLHVGTAFLETPFSARWNEAWNSSGRGSRIWSRLTGPLAT